MTEQTLPGFLLTRHWRDTGQGVELEFWFATERGSLCVRVTGERSVFFLSASEFARARQQLARYPELDGRPLEMRSFSAEPVVGLYFSSYRVARRCADELREAGFDPLESDINPSDRYLMERFIQGAALIRGTLRERGGQAVMENPALKATEYRPALKVVSFDIETAMEGVQLYSIAVHGVDGDREVRQVFMVASDPSVLPDFVFCFESQQALLLAFLDWIARYDPDVLIGWNVVNFDTWYLQRLADSQGIRLRLGRERRALVWRELDDHGERRTAQMPGRVLLDGIELLRAAFYRFESFSLENVARELLGEGKLLSGGDRGQEIGRLFREDKPALARYNLRDCELVSEIFQRTSLLDFALARGVMTGLNIDRLGGSVASFDNLYLPRLHRLGYVAPNASRELQASPGGFVLDSTPGIFDHVLVLDFKSLYPSIIRTFCVDPLGLALGTADDVCEADTVDGFAGGRFAREGHILPDLIRQLWQRRDAAKRAGDGPLANAIKIIMNSFYGVLGTPGCRFFDARLASSITRRGHEILTSTRDYIESRGQQVIYGDTDSVFVWVSEACSDAEAMTVGRQLERELNAWWQAGIQERFGLESVLEVEFETHFKRFLMPTIRGSDKGSKKRYAGVVASPDGDTLVFKGLENVRTDWTRLAREFQEELYRRIFMGEPYEDYVKSITAGVLAGAFDDQLVYRKRLRRRLEEYEKNIPPHVQAARRAQALGEPAPRRGSWVEYVITTAGAEPVLQVQAPLDYQHYVDRQLEPVADGILGFVGTSFARLVDKQIGLF